MCPAPGPGPAVMRDDLLQLEARSKVAQERQAAQEAHRAAIEAAARDLRTAQEERHQLTHAGRRGAEGTFSIGLEDSDDTPDEELIAACKAAEAREAAARGAASAHEAEVPEEEGMHDRDLLQQQQHGWPDLR